MKQRNRLERRKKSAKELQKRNERPKRLKLKGYVLKQKLLLKPRGFVLRRKLPKKPERKKRREYA